MRNALVTGAFGFVGTVLCRQLRAEGVHVRGVARHARPDTADEAISADLTDAPLDPSLFEGIDTVFHLAALADAGDHGPGVEDEYRRVNIEGTRNVLTASRAAAVGRFVFISTVKAMGEHTGSEPQDESAEAVPLSPYGRSKLEAEKLVLEGGEVPEPVVLRLPMVYGGRIGGNMQKMIRAVRARRFPPIPEFGNRRSMVHVEDAAQAAILAATHSDAPGGIFLVTDGKQYSTREIYEQIRAGIGRGKPCCVIPGFVLRLLALIGDAFHAVTRRRLPLDSEALGKLQLSAAYSSNRIREQLGFRPAHTLQSAMPELIKSAVEA